MQYIKEDLENSKKELRNYIYDKRWLEGRCQEIEERRILLEKITTTLTDMPKGTPKVQDKNIDILSDIIDETNELEKLLNDLKNKQIHIESKIDKLDQPYKNILYFRYIKGYNLTEVSNELEREYDYVRRLHGTALVKYAEVGGCE